MGEIEQEVKILQKQTDEPKTTDEEHHKVLMTEPPFQERFDKKEEGEKNEILEVVSVVVVTGKHSTGRSSYSTTHLQVHMRYLYHVITGGGSSSWNSSSSLHTPTAPDKAYDDHVWDTIISHSDPRYNHRVHVTVVIPQV
ncbi:UNVERIFIED_CONTAM: hypothetical protein Sradi_0675500 [Sesamum radiatum]|uniref:Uncharacterized protein n=1 Tax=Sesamum radiatum TaxID=300843 RepID=A0AAW2VM46_SESRA